MLNLGEIKTQVSNMIERPDASFLTRIEGYVNQRYRNIAKRRPWIDLCRQMTITESTSLNYIILPSYVWGVIDIHQTDTPMLLALQRYYNFINRHIQDKADTGNPMIATPVGRIGVQTVMPSDSVITVTSSVTTDITQIVRVRGYNSNGVAIEETIALNGTTSVPGLLTFSSLAGSEPWFSKDTTTNGVISILSGATTIARIAPGDVDVSYNKWSLWPKPTNPNTLYLTFKKDIFPLVNDEDVPEIRKIEDALIQGAYAQCLEEKRQFQKASQAWVHYEEEIQQAINNEPVFEQNFQDQLTPEIVRGADDLPYGGSVFGAR